jgi:hypothetical protein
LLLLLRPMLLLLLLLVQGLLLALIRLSYRSAGWASLMLLLGMC